MGDSEFIKFNIGRSKRKSTWLKPRDFELLKFVATHGLVTQKQIVYFAQNVFELTENGVRTKLQRWSNKDILISNTYGPRNNRKLYFRLGTRGTELLIHNGILTNVPQLNEIRLPKNKDHFIGLRDLIVKTLVEIQLANLNIEVTSHSPYVQIENGELSNQGKTILRPDWILRTPFHNFYIELDTGSEGHSKIQSKVKAYAKLASQNPASNYHVLLTLIDNADDFFTYSNEDHGINRSGRIINLKEVITRTSAHNLPNLKFTVAQISRMHLIASNWAGNGEYKDDLEVAKSIVNLLKHALNSHESFNYTIGQPLSVHDFYLAEVNESLFADEHFLLQSNDGLEEKVMLVKWMREGDVSCFDSLTYLNQLQREGRFKRKVDFIVAYYQTREEMKMDALPEMEHVIYTTEEHLIEQSPFRINPNDEKVIGL